MPASGRRIWETGTSSWILATESSSSPLTNDDCKVVALYPGSAASGLLHCLQPMAQSETAPISITSQAQPVRRDRFRNPVLGLLSSTVTRGSIEERAVDC